MLWVLAVCVVGSLFCGACHLLALTGAIVLLPKQLAWALLAALAVPFVLALWTHPLRKASGHGSTAVGWREIIGPFPMPLRIAYLVGWAYCMLASFWYWPREFGSSVPVFEALDRPVFITAATLLFSWTATMLSHSGLLITRRATP